MSEFVELLAIAALPIVLGGVSLLFFRLAVAGRSRSGVLTVTAGNALELLTLVSIILLALEIHLRFFAASGFRVG